METSLLELIKANKIFASLDADAFKKLASGFKKISVRQNKCLFRQGALSNNLYIVVSGKLTAVLKTSDKVEKIISEMGPGDTIGELSALSHEPTTSTVKALEDSVLLKLPGKILLEACHEYPAIMLEIVNILVTRSRHAIEMLASSEAAKKTMMIVPASKKIDLDPFLKKLKPTIKNQTDELNKADKIYVVAHRDSKPYINRLLKEKLIKAKIKPELVLLHDDGAHLPNRTSLWLKLLPFGLHHHVRLNNEADIQRIGRFMSGTAVGVVLGGGGLRSWAHLGAIRALTEAKIPIDMIGGTSAGAIVAGYYAMHENFNDMPVELQELSEITRQSVSFRHMTWPAVSILDGQAYTQKQKEIFNNHRIENLWLPFFSVACNLSTNSQVINRKNYLWKAIRASTAVPAVFPPVVINGELHLDGGILNNLPVDVMRRFVGERGTVIAIALTHRSRDKTDYNFPPILTLSQTILAKSRLAYKDYKFPRFIDTFLKSLLAGASAKQEANSLAADMLISPDLSTYSLLEVDKEQEAELIKLGYNAALKAIRKWKRKR